MNVEMKLGILSILALAAVVYGEWYPIHCKATKDTHVQMRVYSRDGKLFGECGSCGRSIPLRLEWSTNEAQATLENVPRL